MDQDDINNTEWNDSTNWSPPRWLGIYFSKKDSRSWVPKPFPILGWTVNLGQPKGVMWALLIGAAALAIAFLAGWLSAT
ncbi:DUF5808 domain-containing protein [Idiomarina zobellii]|uniref:DUF5808 domain-containing protein n=1 Tax=Idiomarina zobellii TaxID=86103 RepID=A0A837NDW4_9GAMM|nr:DUF5808 domain-containing protein [Idiomarina zobellii]KPD20785.1 hypothetical protein AFK76_12375 [Idiomarina zobellii]SDG34089.1 hypothetical protein SAMN04515658_12414 [Idiomarina zobellii]